MKKQEKQALVIGSGIGVLVFAFVFSQLYEDFTQDYEQKIIPPSIIVTEEQQEEQKDEVATIGQKFITMMASYDQIQGQPIKFVSVEEQGNVRIAKYEVEQLMEDVSLVYFYTIGVQEGRVVRQNVSVSDRGRRLLLSNPEPDSIIEQKTFTVKGQVFDGQEEVTIRLMNANTDELILEKQVPVELEKNAVYSDVLSVDRSLTGEFILEVEDEQSLVRTLIVLSQSQF